MVFLFDDIDETIKRTSEKECKLLDALSPFFPNVIDDVKGTFGINNAIWENGDYFEIGLEKTFPNGFSCFDDISLYRLIYVLKKNWEKILYANNHDAAIEMPHKEIFGMRSCLELLSYYAAERSEETKAFQRNKLPSIEIGNLHSISDLKQVFPHQGRSNEEEYWGKEKQMYKALNKVHKDFLDRINSLMKEQGVDRVLEETEVLKKYQESLKNEATSIICNPLLSAESKRCQLEKFTVFLINYIDIGTVDIETEGKIRTIHVKENCSILGRFLRDEDEEDKSHSHLIKAWSFLNEPRDFEWNLILYHIYRLNPTESNMRLLSEGIRYFLNKNIFTGYYPSFFRYYVPDSIEGYIEIEECAKGIISYVKDDIGETEEFVKGNYEDDKLLDYFWQQEELYDDYFKFSSCVGEISAYYKNLYEIAKDSDRNRVKELWDDIELERTRREKFAKKKIAVDRLSFSLNTVFLLEQLTHDLCYHEGLIPDEHMDCMYSLYRQLRKIEEQAVNVVYKKKQIFTEARKHLKGLKVDIIKQNENSYVTNNVNVLLEEMLLLMTKDVDSMPEEEMLAKMRECKERAVVFEMGDERIEALSIKFCDFIQTKIQENTAPQYNLIRKKIHEEFYPSYMNFRKKADYYLGTALNNSISSCMDSAFETAIQALSTGEYLYFQYASEGSPGSMYTIDYSSVALEYYLALEAVANLVFYTPYYYKHFYGVSANSISNNSNLLGGTNKRNLVSGGSFKTSLEIGTLGFLYANSTGNNIKYASCHPTSNSKYNKLIEYVNSLGDGLIDKVYDISQKLKVIKNKRNDSAHGSNALTVSAAREAQGIVFRHDLVTGESFTIPNIPDNCREEVIKIFRIFA